MIRATTTEESEEEEQAESRQQSEGNPKLAVTRKGFHSFGLKATGVLYKINPLPEEVSSDVESYIKDGYMQKDLLFVTTVYGLVSPSETKDFGMFWESPWADDNMERGTTSKKRKMEQQQRSLAVRSFIRAQSNLNQDTEDVDKFLQNVNRLNEWDRNEEFLNHGAKDCVKTVSKMVQSFEKKAVLTVLNLLSNQTIKTSNAAIALQHIQRLQGSHASSGDVDSVTHALRRAKHTYLAFANLVAAEILFSEATNGSRNTSIHMSRRMDLEKFSAINTLIDVLYRAYVNALPRDTMGIPLMKVQANVCVSKGVLVVASKAHQKATYILDIDNLDELMERRQRRKSNTKLGLDCIEILAQVFDEEDMTEGHQKQMNTTATAESNTMMGRKKKTLPSPTKKKQKGKPVIPLASLV